MENINEENVTLDVRNVVNSFLGKETSDQTH